MSSHELASQFHGIKENLRKLREAIANGLSQEALLLLSHVSSSTIQLSADLTRYSITPSSPTPSRATSSRCR